MTVKYKAAQAASETERFTPPVSQGAAAIQAHTQVLLWSS